MTTWIIHKLCQAYWEASYKQNNDWCLPFHIVCYHRSSTYAITMIFENYPNAAKVPNKKGWLQVLWWFLRMLCEVYPKAAEVQNRYGYFPLQYALQENVSDVYFQCYTMHTQWHWRWKTRMGKLPLPIPNRIVHPSGNRVRTKGLFHTSFAAAIGWCFLLKWDNQKYQKTIPISPNGTKNLGIMISAPSNYHHLNLLFKIKYPP